MSTEKDINQLFDSIEGIGRVEPSSDFEENLFAKLQSTDTQETANASKWVSWGVAAMLVMAIMNGFVLFMQQTQNTEEVLSELWQTDNSISTDYLLSDDLTQIE